MGSETVELKNNNFTREIQQWIQAGRTKKKSVKLRRDWQSLYNLKKSKREKIRQTALEKKYETPLSISTYIYIYNGNVKTRHQKEKGRTFGEIIVENFLNLMKKTLICISKKTRVGEHMETIEIPAHCWCACK